MALIASSVASVSADPQLLVFSVSALFSAAYGPTQEGRVIVRYPDTQDADWQD